jgi:hypothetical protein
LLLYGLAISIAKDRNPDELIPSKSLAYSALTSG